MFRHESETVIGKAKARASKQKEKGKLKAHSSTTSPSSTSSNNNWIPPTDDEIEQEALKREFAEFALDQPQKLQGGFVQELVPFGSFNFSLKTGLQHRAQAFFYSKSRSWLQNYDLLGTLCNQTTADEHLLASMSAVGLASLSNALHTPELLERSRSDYVTALRLTNEALRSPAGVKKDSTLFSVMILSIYETITGSDERSLEAWTKHINGATALVKLRGLDQFKNEAGQRMFLQVLSYLMLSCIQRTLPMPPHMIKLRDIASKQMDMSKTAWKSSNAIIDFTIFRAATRNCEIVGTRNIFEKARAIDQRFEDIFSTVPNEFQYRTVYTDENPHLVWNGFYHVYTQHWTAQVWNGVRTCRIILNETLRDQMLVDSTAMNPIFSPEEREMQCQASVAIMMECRHGILASVPQHTSFQDSIEPASLLEGSRGYFILWPLYLVGIMDVAELEVREWVVQRLRGIADFAGISQARVLANFIARKINPYGWETKPKPRFRGFLDRIGGHGRFEEWGVDDMDEDGG